MKIIKIERCLDCTYSGIGKKLMQGNFYCRKAQEWFNDNTIVQPWCPLEEVRDADALMEEAKLQAGLQPSKDARVFARNVFNFLTEKRM